MTGAPVADRDALVDDADGSLRTSRAARPRGLGPLLVAVAVIALAARLVPVLTAGTLRGVLGYDDGVHLALAQRLLAGLLPYRDEVFLHPPGIAVLLAPFAATADLLGDSWALALVRLAFMALGATAAVLVALVLAPRGALAAAVGGGAYALWGAAVAAEHTAYLQVPINVGLLVALLALRRAAPGTSASTPFVRRALAVSGVALGLAVTVKTWVVLDAAVLGLLVLSRWGVRAAGRWVAWCVAGAAPVVLPFLVAAPGAFWQDVVVTQLARPRQDKGLAFRLGTLDPTAGLHAPPSETVALGVGLVLLALVLAPLAAATARRVRPRRWADPVWWGLLAAVQLLALALAPSYYLHYAAFVAPALCLLLGAGAGGLVRVVRARGGRPARVGVAALTTLAVVGGAGLALTQPPLPIRSQVDNAALAELVAGHECLWARNPSFLQVADVAADQVDAGCPATPDVVGASLLLHAGGSLPRTSARDLDALVLEELAASDGALLAAHRPKQDLGPRARAYLEEHFTPAGRAGNIELWTRRP